jgi:hypothetical protein
MLCSHIYLRKFFSVLWQVDGIIGKQSKGRMMLAKMFFGSGITAIGAYVAVTMATYNVDIIDKTPDDVARFLGGAQTVIPRKDGDGSIRIWGTGYHNGIVHMRMTYNAGSPTTPEIPCAAVLDPVETTKTKVTVSCASGPPTGDAIVDTTEKLKEPMFIEHVRSQLQGRPFNRQWVDNREAGLVLQNMGGMQREAIKRSQEFN